MEPLASEAFQPPHTLGRYEVLSLLGRGGMANVYLGRHTGEAGFQRLYAIKVLHPHLADEEAFITMLFEEARLAACLHHPNVVPVVDLGSQDGVHYVVMEYVEGCALSVLLRKNRQKRPPRLLLPIILDALNGLHAAHRLTDSDGSPMQLVHRDVSPQNILVGTDGTARLTDFGIAKATSRITSTRPGEIKGKVLYMSPEQIRDGANVDCRADVFSIGVLLWNSLTGEQLFQAPTEMEAFSNILKKKIERPSTVGLKPPPVLDAICLRALERNRDRRPRSAADMEDALRAVSSANGLLGSKAEVAEWVLSVAGPELVGRALAVRAKPHAPMGTSRSLGAPLPPPNSGERDFATGPAPLDCVSEERLALKDNTLEASATNCVDSLSAFGGSTPVVSHLTRRGQRVHLRLGITIGTALVTVASVVAIQFFVWSHSSKPGVLQASAVASDVARLPATHTTPSSAPPPAVGNTKTVANAPDPPQASAAAADGTNQNSPARQDREPRARSATPAGGSRLARSGPSKQGQESTQAKSAGPIPAESPTPIAGPTSIPQPTKKKAPVWDNDSPVPPQ
jgi:eukaryotic-like serine/threonine-protein kinase